MEYVSSKVTIPGRAYNTYAEIIKSRRMARAAIISSIEYECVLIIPVEQNPKVVWNKLADAIKSKRTASIYTHRNRLINSNMTQRMSIRNLPMGYVLLNNSRRSLEDC